MSLRLVTSRQMGAIDRDTIAAGTPGLELMERAGRAACDALDAGGWLDDRAPVLIVCGKGNNGGDGLVMARVLAEAGWPVRVLRLAGPEDLSDDARANHDRLPDEVHLVAGDRDRWAAQVAELGAGCGLAIDAVLGTGIAPPLRDPYPALLEAMNALDAPLIAVDMPSGVSGDDGSADPAAIVADATITMGLPKVGLMLPPGRDHAGRIEVVDIGFPREVIDRHAPPWIVPTVADYRDLLPARPSDMHKYQAGCLLLIAGSRAYAGAAQLGGLGALRTGLGLLTMLVPEGLETPLRVALPEAIVRTSPTTASGTLAGIMVQDMDDLLWKKDAVAIGPGLGNDRETDGWVCRFCERCELPLVIDADGLGAFARLGQTPRFATGEVVLTPHAGELARLLGSTADEVLQRRFELTAELAARWQAVLVLKGSPTLVAAPDGTVVVNPSGDDTLARGGTGDVLTGMIGSFLAQGASALDAATLACWVHGLAGEAAAESLGRRGALVREIADGAALVLAELDA
ncbi:NAD(P)H-hydrate dehydratase [bacterium]|nr:NAD(P)H-hydrate dehydratase [bacterium]